MYMQGDQDSQDPPDTVQRSLSCARDCTGGSGQSGSSGHGVEVSVLPQGLHGRIQTVRILRTQCMGLCAVLGTAREDPDSQDPPDTVQRSHTVYRSLSCAMDCMDRTVRILRIQCRSLSAVQGTAQEAPDILIHKYLYRTMCTVLFGIPRIHRTCVGNLGHHSLF